MPPSALARPRGRERSQARLDAVPSSTAPPASSAAAGSAVAAADRSGRLNDDGGGGGGGDDTGPESAHATADEHEPELSRAGAHVSSSAGESRVSSRSSSRLSVSYAVADDDNDDDDGDGNDRDVVRNGGSSDGGSRGSNLREQRQRGRRRSRSVHSSRSIATTGSSKSCSPPPYRLDPQSDLFAVGFDGVDDDSRVEPDSHAQAQTSVNGPAAAPASASAASAVAATRSEPDGDAGELSGAAKRTCVDPLAVANSRAHCSSSGGGGGGGSSDDDDGDDDDDSDDGESGGGTDTLTDSTNSDDSTSSDSASSSDGNDDERVGFLSSSSNTDDVIEGSIDEGDSDDDDDGSFGAMLLQYALPLRTSVTRAEASVPVENRTVARYTGLRNIATIKEVNFMGPLSDFVVSGSEDGSAIVWDKRARRIVWKGHADSDVRSVAQLTRGVRLTRFRGGGRRL
jgi:hypothetical protein